MIVSLDFELASPLDLAETGADVWTKCPDTVPICAAFTLDDREPLSIDFHDCSIKVPPLPHHFLAYAIQQGAEIHAWNANFEFNVWNNLMVPRHGWPRMPIERFHCTMAAAACAGLPMGLNDAAIAVGSPYLKNKAGHALMKRMARPRSVDADGNYRWWHRDDPAKRADLVQYNIDDVIAEREVHKRIPRMTQRERAIWLVDQHMNARGLPVDLDLVEALRQITDEEAVRISAAIKELTGGEVRSTTLNMRLLNWVRARGYPHNTLERDTLEEFLRSNAVRSLDPVTRSVLLLRAEASKTSTAKLNSIARYAVDGRARNLVQYGGAVRTLRWAGRGPQIQNFPKPVVRYVDQAIGDVLDGMKAEGLRILYGRPLDVVSSCLRGVFKAVKGHKFVVCDYHAIEAVVLAWLAEFDDMLDVFRRKEDIYVFTARSIGSDKRQLGKVLTLACGYGMGGAKFRDTAANYGLDLELPEAVAAVKAFREANKPIVSLWHAYEACAKKAINFPGETFGYKRVSFRMARPDGRLARALLMTLPSGRNLVYRDARIENGRIVFWGVDQYRRIWAELDTYGGKLAENATQAVARDLLADAIVVVDEYWPGAPLTTIHDEIVAMTGDADAGKLLAFMQAIMASPPAWGEELPLSCNGAVVERYGKL